MKEHTALLVYLLLKLFPLKAAGKAMPRFLVYVGHSAYHTKHGAFQTFAICGNLHMRWLKWYMMDKSCGRACGKFLMILWYWSQGPYCSNHCRFI